MNSLVKFFFTLITVLSYLTCFGQEVDVMKPADTACYPADSLYVPIDESPEFPGGLKAMFNFLATNLVYPEAARMDGIQGTVYLTFRVEKSGRIKKVRVLRGIDGGLNKEAVRVVKLMPPWKPGKHMGQIVRVQYILPIKFTLPVEGKNTPE